jgi:carbamoyl-phosphate synthase large subunit
MAGKLSIGVTGTGSLIGQGILKSIQKSPLANEVTITGFDYFERTIGSYWCQQNYLLPDILKTPDVLPQWIEVIKAAIHKHSITLLFIGVDFELPILAGIREQLLQETGCEVMVSNGDVIAIADDKYLTYKFLRDNNLGHPATFLPEEYTAGALPFPLIVKPRIGARSRDVIVVKDAAQLKDAVARVSGAVIQELVGNAATEYTCGIIFLDGELKASIVLNRSLREGNTFKSVFSQQVDKRIYDYIKDVAYCLKPYGSCNLQLRVDEKGQPKIFEINARHSGTTYIRSLFGYNEVEYIINYKSGKKTPAFDLREGTVIRYYDEFFVEEKSL